jgi:hypothetical protein
MNAVRQAVSLIYQAENPRGETYLFQGTPGGKIARTRKAPVVLQTGDETLIEALPVEKPSITFRTKWFFFIVVAPALGRISVSTEVASLSLR